MRLRTQVGQYELLEELGKGGMATLYRGRCSGPGDFSRDVAIKVVHEELEQDPTIVTMFLDEARLAACIQHPNVAQVEALGEVDGRHYIVMELIDGVTLSDILMDLHRTGRQLPVDVAVNIAGQVAAGLHAAHEGVDARGRPLNLIHRDVSPSNVIISRSGHVKLIDFGVAKARHRLAKTTVGSVKGKLAYMAPEQLSGVELDRRADVFALGTVLWESLMLERLFHGKSDLQTMVNVRDKPVPAIATRRDDVSDSLEFVVGAMLSRPPEERFATAAAARSAMLSACRAAVAVDSVALAALVASVSPKPTGPAETIAPPSRARAAAAAEHDDEPTMRDPSWRPPSKG